jgi:hypothetical protein
MSGIKTKAGLMVSAWWWSVMAECAWLAGDTEFMNSSLLVEE